MGTHLNCIDKSMQFKWVPTTYAFIKKQIKKYTGCNLKTTILIDCAVIGVCAVIRSNTVCNNMRTYICTLKRRLKLACTSAHSDQSLHH